MKYLCMAGADPWGWSSWSVGGHSVWHLLRSPTLQLGCGHWQTSTGPHRTDDRLHTHSTQPLVVISYFICTVYMYNVYPTLKAISYNEMYNYSNLLNPKCSLFCTTLVIVLQIHKQQTIKILTERQGCFSIKLGDKYKGFPFWQLDYNLLDY